MALKQDSVHFAFLINRVIKLRCCPKLEHVFQEFFFCLKEGPPPPNPHLGITMDKERSLTNNDETV